MCGLSTDGRTRRPADIQPAVEEMIKTGAKVHIDVEMNVGAGHVAYVYG